ncbi:unnamed protein product [[Candida] boidinii]|nr:unnamed protein product [[Candida] boidinii]
MKIKFKEIMNSYKPLLLFKFLKFYKINDFNNNNNSSNNNGKKLKILIFTNSNENSIRLSSFLQKMNSIHGGDENNKFEINYISSLQKINERNKILKKINEDVHDDDEGGESKTQVLISTDLMARGISIKDLNIVINYELALSTKSYVHRSGRTARANQFGIVVNFLFGSKESNWFKNDLVYEKPGGLVNRNGKQISEIKAYVSIEREKSKENDDHREDGDEDGDEDGGEGRDKTDKEFHDDEPPFITSITKSEQKEYEAVLKELEKESKNRK